MPCLDLFTLRKKVGISFLVTHLRSAEIEPLGGLRRVRESHADLLVRRDRFGKGDDYFFIRELPGLYFCSRLDGVELKVHSVELHLVHWFGDGLQAECCGPLDGVLLEIRRDVESQVQQL